MQHAFHETEQYLFDHRTILTSFAIIAAYSSFLKMKKKHVEDVCGYRGCMGIFKGCIPVTHFYSLNPSIFHFINKIPLETHTTSKYEIHSMYEIL